MEKHIRNTDRLVLSALRTVCKDGKLREMSSSTQLRTELTTKVSIDQTF